MLRHRAIRSSRTALAALALAALTAACASATPTPTPTPEPTPTPPYGLPPLELPADEAPHDFGTEWWYFNVHLRAEDGRRYALHDVVFQIQDLGSSRTLYVRQTGLADVSADTHATAERLRWEPEPLSEQAGVFRVGFADHFVSVRKLGAGGDFFVTIENSTVIDNDAGSQQIDIRARQDDDGTGSLTLKNVTHGDIALTGVELITNP